MGVFQKNLVYQTEKPTLSNYRDNCLPYTLSMMKNFRVVEPIPSVEQNNIFSCMQCIPDDEFSVTWRDFAFITKTGWSINLNPKQAGGGGGAESAHRLVLPTAVLKRYAVGS